MWIGTCALVVVVCLRASSDELNELFHIYYQPLIVMLAMFWLWGVAMRVFELMKVQYQACFSEREQVHLLNSRQVYQVGHPLFSPPPPFIPPHLFSVPCPPMLAFSLRAEGN